MATKKQDDSHDGVEVSGKTLKFRRGFKKLLLKNPNYFGNLEASELSAEAEISGNTSYEEIGCVGFQPQLNRLEAVVFVNQPSGYGGDICTAGTPEYVRFYLSFDGGVTWKDQGVTNFTAYNIPQETEGRKRLEYAVAIEVAPRKRWCHVENTILARAILSWNFEPPADQPNFQPVWGEVHNTHILVDPFKADITVGELLDESEFTLDSTFAPLVDSSQTLTLAKPKQLALADLAKLYQGRVEPRRFGFAHVQKMLDTPGLLEKLVTAESTSIFQDLDIDISDLLVNLPSSDGNTRYEELECVGLDNERDELVAIIRVKKPAGYSGDPCTDGSTEYVTFWGDFDNNGTFETCLGTAQVKVYDIDRIPDEGLEYSLQVPVNLNPYRRNCEEGPRLVPIRAILSWQSAPPCNNPNYVPTWGNREQTLVQIRAGNAIEDGDYTPFLYSLCNQDVCSINQGSGLDNLDRPYGGGINIQGEIPAAPALNAADTLKYKIWVRPLNNNGTPKGSYQALANDFKVTIQESTGGSTPISYPFIQKVDTADGYYTYREYGTSPGKWRRVISPNRQLAQWNSTSYGSGLWEIMIRAKDSLNNYYLAGVTKCVADSSTRQNVKVKLDQTLPFAELEITGFSSKGGKIQPAVDCSTFQIGDVIHGNYTATDAPDDHFKELHLQLQPAKINGNVHGVIPTPSFRSYYNHGVLGSGEAGSWQLDTSSLPACGYTVRLLVRDRTIASCRSGHSASDFVGFCVVEPE